MSASRILVARGLMAEKAAGGSTDGRKEVAVLVGDEAIEIYAAEISRNFARINAQIGMLRNEYDEAARLLRATG